jgi:hypothetical protein
MITPEQEADLRLFIKGIEAHFQPDDEFLRDSVQEIAAYELEGALEQRRDKAVAVYYHRLRMMPVWEQINQ